MEISLDARQLRSAKRAINTIIPTDIRNEMRSTLRTIGRTLKTEAVAAARFSIDPKVVKVRTAGPRVVLSVTKSEDKPHHGEALAFEHEGKPGSFRHPVYGHRSTWVSQQARPWLTPTIEARFDWAYTEIGRAVEDAFRAAGFR